MLIRKESQPRCFDEPVETGSLKKTAVLLLVLLFPGSCWAWVRMGHRVAAAMAEQWLTPAAHVSVHALLGPKASLAYVSTWADEQREVPGSGHWHYVNVPIEENRCHPRQCTARGCAVSKIDDFTRMLLDPKAGTLEKQQALKFLIHLFNPHEFKAGADHCYIFIHFLVPESGKESMNNRPVIFRADDLQGMVSASSTFMASRLERVEGGVSYRVPPIFNY